jgi:ABC-type proline/glycine betaine transport system ATPase subunit
VALARALAASPRLLLLDEPFGALDAVVRRQLRAGLKDIVRTVGVTTVIVTHDQEEAFDLADKVGVWVCGCGGIWVWERGREEGLVAGFADTYTHTDTEARLQGWLIRWVCGCAVWICVCGGGVSPGPQRMMDLRRWNPV